MPAIYANFADSTLAANITNVQTSLNVAAGHGARFPSPAGTEYFYVTLESSALVREIVKVTARATDTFTIVRAQDGTSAAAFTAGAVVALRIIAAAVTEIVPGAGAAGQVLTHNGNTGGVFNAPTYQTNSPAATTPAFSVYISATQAVAQSTWTRMNLNTESFDSTGVWNTGTQRFQPATSGYYLISGLLDTSASIVSSLTALRLHKNGVLFKEMASNAGTTVSRVSGTAVIRMNGTSDYIEFFGFVTSSSSPSFSAAAFYSCGGALIVRD